VSRRPVLLASRAMVPPALSVGILVRVLRVSSLYRSLASPLDCSRGGRAGCS